jgi:aspartate-semialdehyde dehydrogenase
MVLVLAPLHKKYNIKRVVVSTYQSITGTGVKAVEQLENEYAGVQGEMAYKYPFIEMQFHNVMCLKKIHQRKEMKLVRETQKILDDKTIAVTATAVRVPIVGAQRSGKRTVFK